MKLRKPLLTVFAVLCVGFGTLFAQNDRSPISIEQVNNPGIEHNEAVKNFMFDFLLTVDFSEFVSGPLVQGNRATIKQYGNNNNAVLNQSGSANIGYIQMGSSQNYVSGNRARVNQDGTGLISLINMQGNDNYLGFEQMGSNKGALFWFQGDNMKFDAQQVGSGIQLRPKNSTMTPIGISSNQSTVPVIISN
jgi:hypothetical protein